MNIENHNNSGFSSQLAAELATAMMRNMAVLTCRGERSISNSDLEEIRIAEHEVRSIVDSYFEIIRGVTSERRANLERYHHLKVVSLGEDCFCRNIATNWGLKKSAKLGERSHPFDLAGHPLPLIARLIDSNFENYLNPQDFSFSESEGFCRNAALGISYRHERGKEYAADNFRLLRETYGRRVTNFQRCLEETGDRKLFLVHSENHRLDAWFHLRDLVRSLRSACRSCDFVILCINTSGVDIPERDSESRSPDDDLIEILNAPYPMENYIWHPPRFSLSPQGYRFEKALVDRIKEVMDRRFPFKPTAAVRSDCGALPSKANTRRFALPEAMGCGTHDHEPHESMLKADYVALPGLSLAIHSIPKNGGSSLLETAWLLKAGGPFPKESFDARGVYAPAAVQYLWGEQLSSPERRLVVLRDPVDRAVSLYRRGVKLGYLAGHSFESVLQDHEGWVRRSVDYAHHARSQWKWIGGRALAEFTHIVPFSCYQRVFELLETWSGIPLPRLHLEQAAVPAPEVSDLAREMIRRIWRDDYEQGIAEAAAALEVMDGKSIAVGKKPAGSVALPRPRKRILVLGMARSHTSAISTAIAAGLDVPMVFEPFRPRRETHPNLHVEWDTHTDQWEPWSGGPKRAWMRQFGDSWVLKSLFVHAPELGFLLADLADHILLTQRDALECCCSLAVSKARKVWVSAEEHGERLPPVEVSRGKWGISWENNDSRVSCWRHSRARPTCCRRALRPRAAISTKNWEFRPVPQAPNE